MPVLCIQQYEVRTDGMVTINTVLVLRPAVLLSAVYTIILCKITVVYSIRTHITLVRERTYLFSPSSRTIAKARDSTPLGLNNKKHEYRHTKRRMLKHTMRHARLLVKK